MKRLAWLTDIHLNFLRPPEVDAFLATLAETVADGFLLSGDIAESHNLALYLNALENHLQRPLYFVLGNHDFYRSSIAAVRAEVEALCAVCPHLCWLPQAGVVPLTTETALVGHDGWADGRLGDYWGSSVRLNDWRLIQELVGLNDHARLARLHALGDEAAAHLRTVLPDALARFPHVIVLTHVPPFREACWHQGQLSNDHWLPHFTCQAVGAILIEMATAHQDRRLTVLCGHTHGEGQAELLSNLRVLTGGAEYGKPRVQQILEVE